MGRPGEVRKKDGRGRPRKPETVMVRIGKREYELTFTLVGMSRDRPFREVYLELVRKAGAEVPA